MFDLSESLDKIHPVTRVKPHAAWITDEWHFEVGSTTHVIRASKVSAKDYGPKSSILIFGIKKSKKVSKKLVGVTNIRQYLATVVSVIEQMHENPTTRGKMKGDGFIIAMDEEIFEKRGHIFGRILRKKLRDKFKMHRSYFEVPTDETMKAIYIWKKERSFKAVFPSLGVEDDSDDVEPFVAPEKATVDFSTVVKDMVKTKLNTVEPVVKKKEPIIDVQLTPKVEKVLTFAEKQEIAKKEVLFSLKEKKVNTSSYIKLAVLYSFFSRSYGSERWARDTSLDVSSVSITIKDLIEYTKKVGNFTGEFQVGLASEKECLLALNMSNIKTDYIYDFIENQNSFSDHFLRDLEKLGINRSKLLENLPKTFISNVHIDKIIDICLNAKKILKEKGFELKSPDDSNPYYARQTGDIRANRTLSSIITENLSSDKEIEDLFNAALVSINTNVIENLNPFQYRRSSKGSKEVKNQIYDFKDPGINTLREISDAILNIKDKEKYYKLKDRLPYYMQGLVSENLEFFETVFISNWTIAGGSDAQILGHEVFHGFGVNAELDDFYTAEDNIYSRNSRDEFKYRKERLNDHLGSLYEKNQKYYKEKYKKKYDTKTIRLYRGIGIETVDTYIPGSLESWTTNLSTAKKFGEMMSRRNEKYTILLADVPIQDIFGSWDSFAETWPGEEDLKGKKEYMVMGGTFATTPIYVYDLYSKTTTNTLKPFKEWLEFVTEEELKKNDPVKIITPSMPNFRKALDSGKAALGNDPKENEVRKSDETDKSEG